MKHSFLTSFMGNSSRRNLLLQQLFAGCLFALYFVHSGQVEAKSQTFSNPVDRTALNAYFTTITPPFWSIMLTNTQVSVTYNAVLTNAQTGNAITDGSTFLVGTQIRCAAPYSGADISWFGIGYGYDSPNGHWVNNAAEPSGTYCEPADRIINLNELRFFVPFNIHRPQHTCSFTGTAGVTQLSSDTWQVTSPGTLVATVNYPATYGIYYLGTEKDTIVNQDAPDEYRIVSNTCVESPYPLSVPNGQTWVNDPTDSEGGYYVPTYGAYQVNFAARSITHNLTATNPNSAPQNLQITGPTSGIVNTPYNFSLTATDADGNQLKYGLSDASCTAVYEWIPSSGLVNQNTSQTFSKLWSGIGPQTLYVFAQDSNGSRSACASHTITISPAPAPTASLKVNGSTGPINVNKNTTVTLAWSSANAPSCSKWGGSWGSGQVVGVSGSATTLVTTTTTYLVSCGGVQSTVTVNVVNQVPAAPSITYVSGTLQTNQTLNFSVQGIDPDSDNIFYEIDWMDGSPLATTQTVPSNTSQPATHAFNNAGANTFQVRTVDTAGAFSGWASHTITINSAPPPITTLEASINGGPFGTTDQTVNPSDTISLRWSSSNAATCSGSGPGFDTGGATANTDGVTTPAPNTSNSFTATCTGSGGSGVDSLTITTRQLANFSRPNITHQLSPSFSTTTGTYDYVDVSFNTTNTGSSDTQSAASYELKFDRGRDGYEVTTTGSLGLLPVSQTVTRTERVSGGIPYGNTRVEVTVDHTNTIPETNEGDNTFIYNLVITPPDPGLNITVDRNQVRNGERVTLNWNTPVTYPLNCRVYGPALDVNPSGRTGVMVTPSPGINAKSVYTYSCVEPLTNTTFIDTVSVETQGKMQEL